MMIVIFRAVAGRNRHIKGFRSVQVIRKSAVKEEKWIGYIVAGVNVAGLVPAKTVISSGTEKKL